MNIFTKKIIKDFTFMETIWINYPETKEVREQIAKNVWEYLYYENKSYENLSSTYLEDSMSILLPFKKFTINNSTLTSKIISDFFLQLRENWNDITPIEDLKKDVENLTIKKIILKRFRNDKLRIKHQQFKRKMNYYKHEESNLIKYQNRASKDELKMLKSLLENSIESTSDKKTISKLNLTMEEIEKYKANWENLQKTMEDYFLNYYELLKISRELFHDPDLIPGMGWDLEKGKLTRSDFKKFLNISQTLQNKPELIALIEQLGRSQVQNQLKKHNGIDKETLAYLNNESPKELLGINQGDDLSRILPSELVNLKNKNLKNIFYSKLLEKKLIQYQLSGEKNIYKKKGKINLEPEKGPIIACIDTSSSMEGLPEEIAKGIVIKLYNISKKEKRKVYLIVFSSTDELVEIEITKKTNFSTLIKFLQQSFFGGTDYTFPLRRAIDLIEKNKYPLADILMITDGLCKIDDSFLKFLNNKRNILKFKIYTLVLSHRIENDSYSDKIINYKVEPNNNGNKNMILSPRIDPYNTV